MFHLSLDEFEFPLLKLSCNDTSQFKTKVEDVTSQVKSQVCETSIT